MSNARHDKMSSRELGLVLAQQLLQVEDLHYGLWDDDLPLTLGNLPVAQQRYSDYLLARLETCLADRPGARILDVGCGTGHLLTQLLDRGYRVDAVNPAEYLNRQVKARLARLPSADVTLFECRFEDLEIPPADARYDLLLFSESFQYIPLPAVFSKAPQLLQPDGQLLVCDFFKTAAHRRGGAGDLSFSGGHVLEAFEQALAAAPFTLSHDEDLTARVSPGIALLDEWLTGRLRPATESIATWLQDNYPRSSWLLKRLLRRKLARLQYKYLAGNRTQAVFETYKTYRLLVLQHAAPG